jgi:glutamate decarboxylase
VQQYSRDVAQDLAREVGKLGPFKLVTRGTDLPVFAFKVRDEITNFNVYDVSDALRERGWQVPAYTFPKNREDLAVLRVVVKRGFTHDVASIFIDDLRRQLTGLEAQPAPVKGAESSSGFKH